MDQRRVRAICAVVGVAIGTLFLTACAGYCITDEATGKEGYVVYQPHPYLLTSPTITASKVAYTGEIVYLPNFNRPMRIRTWSGLGKATFTFHIAHGWQLTSIHAQTDNTEILKQIVGLIPDLPPLDGKELAAAEALPEARLYRLEFDHRSGHFVGLVQVPMCHLNCAPGGTSAESGRPSREGGSPD